MFSFSRDRMKIEQLERRIITLESKLDYIVNVAEKQTGEINKAVRILKYSKSDEPTFWIDDHGFMYHSSRILRLYIGRQEYDIDLTKDKMNEFEDINYEKSKLIVKGNLAYLTLSFDNEDIQSVDYIVDYENSKYVVGS